MRCAEAAYPPGLVLAEHSHENASITVVLDGSFDESGPRAARSRCARWSVVVRPWGAPHTDRIGQEGARNLEIELGRPWAEQHGLEDLLAAPRLLRHPRLALLARAIRTEMRARDAARTLVLEGLALELVGAAMRFGPGENGELRRPPAWLEEARRRIEGAFREEVRLGDLAARAGVHPVHLARSFRAHLGSSPGAYLRRLRIQWAAEALLESPEKSITEVALEAGFYDHGHFARAFRAALGTTPSRYRRARAR